MEPNEFVPCKVVIPSLEVKYEIFIRLLKPVERSSLSQRVPYSTVIHVTRGGGGGGGGYWRKSSAWNRHGICILSFMTVIY